MDSQARFPVSGTQIHDWLWEERGSPAMVVARQTLLSAAYDNLRAAILDGSLPPGSRVTVRPLSEQLGLSPTPIKAALAALEREGFLIAIPHRGYFVPEVGTDDLLELYELREAVDGIAARRAAASANHAKLAQKLQRLLDRQRKAVSGNTIQSYLDLDLAFHQLIWEGAGSRRLLPIAANLVAQVRLGNRLSAQVPGRLPRALEEHEAILEAIRDGDSRAAERHTRRHVGESGRALRRYSSHPPETGTGTDSTNDSTRLHVKTTWGSAAPGH